MKNKERTIKVKFCLFHMMDLDKHDTYINKKTTVREMPRSAFAEILAYGSQAVIEYEGNRYQVVKVDLVPHENYVLSLPEIHMLQVDWSTTRTHNFRRANGPLLLTDLFKDKDNE